MAVSVAVLRTVFGILGISSHVYVNVHDAMHLREIYREF